MKVDSVLKHLLQFAISLAIAANVWAVNDPNHLYLYDNFDGTGCKHTQAAWMIDTEGAGVAEIDGPYANIDMHRSPAPVSHARIEAALLDVQFDAVGDTFWFAWDMQRANPDQIDLDGHTDDSGYSAGIAIGNNATNVIYGGLFGGCGTWNHSVQPSVLVHCSGDRAYTAWMNSLGASPSQLPGPQVWYHFDLRLRLETIEGSAGRINTTLKVYDRVEALDSDPEAYNSETPVWEASNTSDSISLPVGQELKTVFYANNFSDDDSSGGGRERTWIYVDNVYTSNVIDILVPDPAQSCGTLVTDMDGDGLVDLDDLNAVASELLDDNIVWP